MTTIIRHEELPDDVPLQMWVEGDDTIIVVNSTLPARKQRAALRAALKAFRSPRRGALLPLPIALTSGELFKKVKEVTKEVREHPALTTAGVVSSVLATVLYALLAPDDQRVSAPQAIELPSVSTIQPTVTEAQPSPSPPVPTPRPKRTQPSAVTSSPPRASRPPRATSAPTPARPSSTPTRRRPSAAPLTSPPSQGPVSRPEIPRPTAERTPEPASTTALPRTTSTMAPPTPPPPPPAPSPQSAACAGIGLEVSLPPLVGVDACLLG